MEHIYEEKIDKMSPETREKYPSNLRPNYVYEATKRLEICTKKPVLAEKERDECSTAWTVHNFFEKTYTTEIMQDDTLQLFLNADETSVEVGLPKKVLVPKNETEGRKIDDFANKSHISAMITINATGDEFIHYILIPL